MRQSTPVFYAFKYLNSSESQRKYPERLKLFFNHIGLTGAAAAGAGDNESIIGRKYSGGINTLREFGNRLLKFTV
jgi:hypothetical protein